MCQTAITLVSNALSEVTNAELLLKIKGIIALFIQTMTVQALTSVASIVQKRLIGDTQSYGYPAQLLDAFLLTLFDKYAELLKRRFSDDFQEVKTHTIRASSSSKLTSPDRLD